MNPSIIKTIPSQKRSVNFTPPRPKAIAFGGVLMTNSDVFEQRFHSSIFSRNFARPGCGAFTPDVEQRNCQGEREEVRQIYAGKGFSGSELEYVVRLITSDRRRWIATMMAEEYGLPTEIRSAWIAGAATFAAFLVCGLIPLLPYILGASQSFLFSAVLTGAIFFLIGSVKSRWSTDSWLSSGLTTFLIGGSAAALAYLAGVILKSVVP